MMLWISSMAALLGSAAIWWVCSISINRLNNQLILHEKTRTREQEKWTGMTTMTTMSMRSSMTTYQLYQMMMHTTSSDNKSLKKNNVAKQNSSQPSDNVCKRLANSTHEFSPRGTGPSKSRERASSKVQAAA